MAAGGDRGRPRKRELRWTLGVAAFNAQAAGTIAVNVISAETFAQTIMRTRGELLGDIDGLDAPGALVRWAFGMIVVPEGQAGVVIWSPITDPNAPWFLYAAGHLGYEEYVTDAIQAVEKSSFRRIMDSKAMRKLPPDTEVQAVLEQVTVGDAASINLNFVGRILLGR